MGLTFTSDARPPSNTQLLPNRFLRPAFGELYGFDADADTDAPVSSDFQITIFNTESNILARTGDAVGTIAFGTDTNDYYISDGNNNWSITLNVNF